MFPFSARFLLCLVPIIPFLRAAGIAANILIPRDIDSGELRVWPLPSLFSFLAFNLELTLPLKFANLLQFFIFLLFSRWGFV